jgi:hypothetical protein
VQPQSPEFMSKYEGINQDIEIELSILVFSASPCPVIALYGFIMATFVSNSKALPLGIVMPVLSLASPYAASNNATNIQVSETRDSWEDSPEF